VRTPAVIEADVGACPVSRTAFEEITTRSPGSRSSWTGRWA
jgi:hypothetical protein